MANLNTVWAAVYAIYFLMYLKADTWSISFNAQMWELGRNLKGARGWKQGWHPGLARLCLSQSAWINSLITWSCLHSNLKMHDSRFLKPQFFCPCLNPSLSWERRTEQHWLELGFLAVFLQGLALHSSSASSLSIASIDGEWPQERQQHNNGYIPVGMSRIDTLRAIVVRYRRAAQGRRHNLVVPGHGWPCTFPRGARIWHVVPRLPFGLHQVSSLVQHYW